jgi:hypothetical protein
MTYAFRAWWGLPQVAFVWLLTGTMLLAVPGLRTGIDSLLRPPPGLMLANAPPMDEMLEPTTAAPPAGPAPAPPFVLQVKTAAEGAQAIRCLAEAVYYEAGTEPVEGQRAVAQVVLNRVRDPNFPSSICGVVYQGHGRRSGCQFSFACDGSLRRRPPTDGEMRDARQIAEAAVNGYVVREVGTATHYHAVYVDPWWRSTLVQIARVGDHIFYRWPGQAGSPAALTDRYTPKAEMKFASIARYAARG